VLESGAGGQARGPGRSALGRAYLALGDLTLARACQREALKLAPDYTLAREAIRRVQELIQARNRAVLA